MKTPCAEAFPRSVTLFLAAFALMIHTACHHDDSRQSGATQLQWEKLSSIPDPEGFAGAFAGTHNGALIVAGGANIVGDKWGKDFKKVWYDSIFVLENPQGKWRTGFKLPKPLGYGVSISTKDGVICIGGSDSNGHHNSVFRLSWEGGELHSTPLPSLPKACANFCGARVGDVIYVAGGLETPNSTNTMKTFWKLELGLKDSHWEELEPWPGPERMLAVAGEMGGSFYLFTGTKLAIDSNGKPVREYLRDAYSYTPGIGWKRLADSPRAAVAAPSPAIGFGNNLLLFTGDDGTKTDFQPVSEHPGFPRDLLAFDVKNNSWSAPGELPFSLATAPVVEWKGYIVVPNGEVRPRQRTPEVWGAKILGSSPLQ